MSLSCGSLVPMSDNYPWDVGRTEDERTFLRRLKQQVNARAPFDAWTFHPQLVVTVSISDPDQRVVLRTLRVDFDGSSLTGGNDPSHQMTEARLNPGDPYPEDPDYFELLGADSVPEVAQHALAWFQR